MKFKAALLGVFIFFGTHAQAMSPFSDVPSSNIYTDGIHYVYQQGIVSGFPDGSYQPEKTINRAEFTKIIIEATVDDASIVCRTPLAFRDSDPEAWYAKYICTAQHHGIIQGYDDGTFKPANTINIAEAVKIIAEGFNYDTSNAYQQWYAGYAQALTDRNAIPAEIGTISDALTRGQMAEIIYRLHANVTNKPSRSFGELTGI